MPRADDYYHLLLYHCLLQKRRATNLADKAASYLAPMARSAGVLPPPTLDEPRATSRAR